MFIANALRDAGFGVQFEHDESKEAYVALWLDGKEIVSHKDLQHNRNYDKQRMLSTALVEEFVSRI